MGSHFSQIIGPHLDGILRVVEVPGFQPKFGCDFGCGAWENLEETPSALGRDSTRVILGFLLGDRREEPPIPSPLHSSRSEETFVWDYGPGLVSITVT